MQATNVGVLLGLALARLLLSRVGMRASVMTLGMTLMIGACAITATTPAALLVMVLIPPLVVATLLPFVDSRAMRGVIAVALAFDLLLLLIARLDPLHLPTPPEAEQILIPLIQPFICAALLALLWQFHHRITDLLLHAEQINIALQQSQITLEDQVSARTAELQRAVDEIVARSAQQDELLSEVAQQREAIRELSVPLLPVAHDTLVLPLVGALDSARIRQLHEHALATLERTRARRLLIDVTGVPVIDTQVAHGIIQTIQAARLLGADSVLVGIRPEVAQTIVGLGIDLSGIHTFPDLETALAR
ncbi:STAS domain-containing protein [Chloroflexales bacterium ZM16-3]|nr:STAS domain-containing protein [Chloroflexales bacterium ZM16-3]